MNTDPTTGPLVIRDDAVRACLNHAPLAHRIAQAFDALARGQAAIQPRARIDCGPVKLSAMGAIWLEAGLACEKVYPTVNGQFGFLLNLFDTRTGQPLAVMPGQAITAFRTPALTLLALQKAVRRPGKLALFGAGLQGQGHVDALLANLPFAEVAVVDLDDARARCAQWAQRHGVRVHQTSAEEAVRGADAVVTVTRSKTPVFDGAWLSPGATVAAIGTSLPTGRELDDTTLSRAARVVVEWKPQSLMEAGEVVLGVQSGALRPERVVDWVELRQHGRPWRENEDEIVVFKSVGVGLTDLAAADLVWQAHRAAEAA